MTHWPGIRRIFRLDRGDVERSVDDELRFHFDTKVDDLMRRGLDATEAAAQAQQEFGDVEHVRQRLRTIDRSRDDSRRRSEWLAGFAQDMRFALRGLRLRPWFAIAAIATLALGIGANVTMFGVVDRLLFRPPPYLTNPSEVNRVYLSRTEANTERTMSAMAYQRYLDLAQWSSTAAQTAAVFDNRLAIGTGEATHEAPVVAVSASFWPLFNAQPALGRFFTAEEDRAPVGTAVAVLGYAFWKDAYGGDAGVVGKSLQIGRQSYIIIGVAPREFTGMSDEVPVAFLPITAEAIELGGHYECGYGLNWMSMVVRRKPGVSVAAASADLTAVYRRSYRLEQGLAPGTTIAEIARPHALAGPVLEERGPNQSSDSRVAIWLIAVAIIVLIIACANVGNLLLARALTRQREVAVRLALGVRRSRLIAQTLMESLLMSGLGGVLGIIIAHWGGAVIRATLLPGAPVSGWGDTRILVFTGIAVVFAGAIAGVVPAIQSTRTDLTTALKNGTRGSGQARSPTRSALLVLQASLSLVLLVGAGLFVRSLRRAEHTSLGYDADRMLWISVAMRGTELTDAQQNDFDTRLLATARALPEAEAATRIVSVPFERRLGRYLFVSGIDSVDKLGEFWQQMVSGDYFKTTGTTIVRGEPITDAAVAASRRVIVVSQSMANVLWPHTDAIGQCIRVSADTMPCTTVIGIAQDIKTNSLSKDAGLLYYLPIGPDDGGGLFIRTRGAPATRVGSVRRALQRIIPGSGYVTVRPFSDIIQQQMRSWQLGATMFTAFGALALLIAAVGLYSVVAYGVVQRSHEMGVRMALGAQASDVVRLVVMEVLGTAVVAIALGITVALAVARLVQPLLFGVSSRDPVILAMAAGALLVIAVAAGLVPALRAARVDPNVALRAE